MQRKPTDSTDGVSSSTNGRITSLNGGMLSRITCLAVVIPFAVANSTGTCGVSQYFIACWIFLSDTKSTPLPVSIIHIGMNLNTIAPQPPGLMLAQTCALLRFRCLARLTLLDTGTHCWYQYSSAGVCRPWYVICHCPPFGVGTVYCDGDVICLRIHRLSLCRSAHRMNPSESTAGSSSS